MPHRPQRIVTDQNKPAWIVVDSAGEIVPPVAGYLQYLVTLERSPNTVRAYAGHLARFWEFLEEASLDWKQIKLANLADFIAWLRKPRSDALFHDSPKKIRAETTVNNMVTVVYNFYEFQRRIGTIEGIDGHLLSHFPKRRYKPFLHHITKRYPTTRKLAKLKEPRRLPETLEVEDIEKIINACQNLRDKFLVLLLYETGMRIGQALGLRHEDIHSWDNEIRIVPRDDNENGARAKTDTEYIIHVSKALMELYASYLVEEYPAEADSGYVFVNIKSGKLGSPMTYGSSQKLIGTIQKRTGIDFHWHMFRHTHATDLIQHGWGMEFVQKRLGHKSVQTTSDIYVHLSDSDLRKAYEEFLEKRKNLEK